jgi:hypothetical protein
VFVFGSSRIRLLFLPVLDSLALGGKLGLEGFIWGRILPLTEAVLALAKSLGWPKLTTTPAAERTSFVLVLVVAAAVAMISMLASDCCFT